MAMRFRVPLVIGMTGLALMLAACGGGSDSDDGTSTTEPTSEATGTTVATEEPDDGDGAELFGGIAVADYYQNTCSACHGADRKGITGLGLPLLPDALTQDDQFYIDTITNGRPGTAMPSWAAAGLTEDEIKALVAFIRTEP